MALLSRDQVALGRGGGDTKFSGLLVLAGPPIEVWYEKLGLDSDVFLLSIPFSGYDWILESAFSLYCVQQGLEKGSSWIQAARFRISESFVYGNGRRIR